MKPCLLFILLFFAFTGAPAAEQQAVIVRLATVYADASSLSARVGQMSAGSRVSVFERQGGWKQIFSDEKAILGWVRSFQVREASQLPVAEVKTESDSRGFLSGLATLSRKASGFFNNSGGSSSSSTATIGVRGLSESEIKSAKPDFKQLAKLKTFASSKKRMTSFTRKGSLKAKSVAYLPGGK